MHCFLLVHPLYDALGRFSGACAGNFASYVQCSYQWLQIGPSIFYYQYLISV